MRRMLFATAAVLVLCAVVIAADKLSALAKQKVVKVKEELGRRVKKTPLSFHELCEIEGARLKEYGYEDEEEHDPLASLRALRYALHRKIRELNPYWRIEKEPEKEYEYVHKQYDIADLVTRPPDRPAPVIGLGYGPNLEGSTMRGAGGGGIIDLGNGEDEGVGVGFDWEKIAEVLDMFLPEDYGDEREIRYAGGRLICRITEEDARKLEELLRQLRQTAGYSVNIEVKFIRATAKYLRELGQLREGSAIYLSEPAEKRLLADLDKKNGVESVASSEVIASDGQMVHIREGRQVSLLMDYDINTVGIPTLQPVVKLVNEGLICQFVPTVVQGGKKVSINVLASLSIIGKEMRMGDFFGGELMFPAMAMSRLRTDVEVPSGRAILVGGTALMAGDDKKKSHEFVVYLKPTVNRKRK